MDEVVLDIIPSKTKLLEAFSSIFNISSSRILLVKNEEEIIEEEFICVTRRAIGDFPLLLSIYTKEKFKQTKRIEYVTKLCEYLDCECLISDDDIEPFNSYSFLKIDSKGKSHIYLTNEQLDNLDNSEEYILKD